MKPNYKNWVPKGMVVSFVCGTVVAAVALIAVMRALTGTLRIVFGILLGLLTAVLVILSLFFININNTFSYDGRKQFDR